MKRAPVLSTLLVACAGPGLRGATSVDPEGEPALTGVTTFRTASCRDELGAPLANIAFEYALLEPARGPKLLLERRRGHDSVLIQNSYGEGAQRVFAYVSDDARHPKVLHHVRLGNPAVSGELRVSRSFRTHDTPDGFRVDAERVVLRCALAPLQRDADAAHGDAGR